MPNIIDLEKLREKDKKTPPPLLTEEDKKLIEEQKHTGELMENVMNNERLLRHNKELFNSDESLMLYRLPLSETQRKEIYNNLIKSN